MVEVHKALAAGPESAKDLSHESLTNALDSRSDVLVAVPKAQAAYYGKLGFRRVSQEARGEQEWTLMTLHHSKIPKLLRRLSVRVNVSLVPIVPKRVDVELPIVVAAYAAYMKYKKLSLEPKEELSENGNGRIFYKFANSPLLVAKVKDHKIESVERYTVR